MKIAILGAGLSGRLLAMRLVDLGASISLFDPDFSGQQSCGYQAAGMIAPISELTRGEPLLAILGVLSLKMWPFYSKKLKDSINLNRSGTLWLAHAREKNALMHHLLPLKSQIEFQWRIKDDLQKVVSCKLQCAGGINIEHEVYVNPRHFFRSSLEYLKEQCQLIPRKISLNDRCLDQFDWIIDTRGLGALDSFKTLRGIRGELLRLKFYTDLKCMIRFFTQHGIYYLVPHGHEEYVLGGTEIETDASDPVTVDHYLDLLATVTHFLPDFRQAQLLSYQIGMRPVLPSGLPFLKMAKNRLSINGLYRHGFLLAPFFVEWVAFLVGLTLADPSLNLTKADRERLCKMI